MQIRSVAVLGSWDGMAFFSGISFYIKHSFFSHSDNLSTHMKQYATSNVSLLLEQPHSFT